MAEPKEKEKHLSKSIGMEVELKTFKPVNGSKDFEGVLKAFDNDTLTLTVEDDQDLFSEKRYCSYKNWLILSK